MEYVTDNNVPGSSGQIPIFTDQFLEHNKGREAELRKLRKITTEFEEQNAILAKHIENMKAAEIKLRYEMTQMRDKNQDVIDHLEKLKVQFVHQFSNIPIPGTNEYPTLATVESYITRLHDKILEQQKVKGNKENELIQERLHQFVTLMADCWNIDLHIYTYSILSFNLYFILLLSLKSQINEANTCDISFV